MAVNRGYGQDAEVDFLDVTAWGDLAERVQQYQRKGSRVLVEGRLQVNKFQDKDGNNRRNTIVNAYSITFLDTKAESEAGSNNTSEQTSEVPF